MTDPAASPNEFERDKPGTNARTDAEAAIEELRQRGGIFVDAVRATRMAMALTDPALPGNPIVFANQSFLDLSGYSMEEVLGQQPFFMNGPETDPDDSGRFRRILEEDRDGVIETVQYAKDGRRFVATVLLTAFKDGEGNTLNHFLSWADVTRRVDAEDDLADLQKAQAALRESERKYRTLFDSIDEGFCVIEMLFDEAGRPADYVFLETNPAFERQTGLVDAVGKRMRDLAPEHEQHWFDIYSEIAKTGESQRFERPAEALGRWYDVYAFRIGRPEQRRVAILFNDISERKRTDAALRESEERQKFLLMLSDALRPIADAGEAQRRGMESLLDFLKLDQTFYFRAEHGVEGWSHIVEYDDVRRPGIPVRKGRRRHAQFGAGVFAGLAEGQIVKVADVERLVGLTSEQRSNYEAAKLRAFLVVPIMKEGRFVAGVSAQSATPRDWTRSETAIVQEVAERTWAAAERATAERALAASELKYRSLFETMGQGYCELELVRDEEGRAVDQLYLEMNPAFERLFGIAVAEAKGRRASEVFPIVDPVWTERFERVARTGTPEHFENQHGPEGRWFETNTYPASGDRVVILYEDITERKRAEERLRQSEERQRFLLSLGDAMRAEASASGKIEVAARHLGELLGASRVLWAEYDHDKGLAHIFSGWFADGALPFPAVARFEDFEGQVLSDLRAGRTVRVDDVGVLVDEPGYANISNAGVQALLSVPLMVDGKLAVNISVHQHEARHWTDEEVALVTDVAERLWAEVVAARAEAALRASEERFRRFGEASQDVLWMRDAETLQWIYLTPAFETIYGLSREDALKGDNYRSWLDLVVPEDRQHAAREIDRVRSGEQVTFEYRIKRPGDGRICWLRNTDFPITDSAGKVVLIGGIGHDVTALRESEEGQRKSEERFGLIVENARDYAIFTTDADGRIDRWYDGAAAVFGWTAEEAVGQFMDMTFTPEDRAKGEPANERAGAARDGRAPDVRWHICKAGERVFVDGVTTALRDADGTLTGFLKIGQDVTERRRAEESLRGSEQRARLLLAELQHRVRNIMAMIRSVARRTGETAETVDDYVQHLEGRISAMARTQALLTRDMHAAVDLQSLILDELSMQAAQPGQYSVTGPDVSLPPKAAEVLGLAIHELATNAVKYGALSERGRRLDVRWALLEGEEAPQLSLVWSEFGTRIDGEPTRSGFGTELITQRVPYELQGTGTMEFRPTGLVATLEFPLADLPSILQTDEGKQAIS